MRDGPLRAAVKWVARLRFAADLAAVRALRRRGGGPWHELGGECRRCARCCEAPSIRANALVWHLRTPRAAFLWWQRVVNGFELQEARRAERTFVFRCTHFDWETRACDSYDTRPGICRDYPRALLDQPQPELLPGCGYRAVTPGARRMLTVLDQQPLTGEQRARLKRDLRLE
jgi:uncharacterized cysteine cluster protein YcgN (CxxCxxCC family)